MQHAWRPDVVRFDLKKDRLAATDILRPVLAGPGNVTAERIASSTVVFEPKGMFQSPPPVTTIEEQTNALRARIVTVTSHAEDESPVMLTFVKFKAKLTRALAAGLFRSAWIERERIKAHLTSQGFARAAEAVNAMPLPRAYIPPPRG